MLWHKKQSTTSSRSYSTFSYGPFFIPLVRINYVFLFVQTDQLLFSIYFILSLTQLIFMSLLTWLVSALKARTLVFFKVLNTFYMSYIYLLKYHCILREGSGNPLQYSCLENPMDGFSILVGSVHWVTTERLSNFTFLKK